MGQVWYRYGISMVQVWDKYGMGGWYDIIISHASEDNKMFTLHDHEPACVTLTLLNFVL